MDDKLIDGVPERMSYWVNEYDSKQDGRILHVTKASADSSCVYCFTRTAVIELVFEDNKFKESIRHAI